MRLISVLPMFVAFASAAALCFVAAFFSVRLIEEASQSQVRAELDRDALTWVNVDTDGLEIFLIGTAPNEAARFQALSAAGRAVDATRVIDQIDVTESADLVPPRFSIEILRNDSGISLIGLIPTISDREALVQQIGNRTGEAGRLSDLLEVADFPAPEGWDDAVGFAIDVLRKLPRSKISVEAGRVAVTAMAESDADRRRLETDLARDAPEGLRLALQLTAPRPVISPFTLRFVMENDRLRFDACTADSVEARVRILRAASQAGLQGKIDCTIALGVPSQSWGEAAETAIATVAAMGGGSVTFSDADVTLVAPQGTAQDQFDRLVGELDAALPDLFALHAVLPKAPSAADAGPPEFTAIRSPEGDVQLRGRVNSEVTRQTADSYARARFGSDLVYTAARVDETLPQAWSVRVLAALEALAQLESGAVTVTPDTVVVTGDTGQQDAREAISQLLADKLGESDTFSIRVTYLEKLDASLGLPSPEECELRITEIIGDRKIGFEPGSATLDASAKDILDDLAELLQKCGDIPLEIGGHTDSQGRETMNQQLSQQRAQSVLDALRIRQVLVASYTARGYGEEDPVATNDTADGREANRRIEFHLIRPDPIPETETTLESVEETDTDTGDTGQ